MKEIFQIKWMYETFNKIYFLFIYGLNATSKLIVRAAFYIQLRYHDTRFNYFDIYTFPIELY